MLKHFVEIFFPGAIVSERKVQEVEERNSKMITIPEKAFAFRFFDCTVINVEGETFVGNKQNFSPFTYFGTEYTLNEVKTQFPDSIILIENMEINGWNRVVKTRAGNWLSLEKDDMVIQS